MNTLLLAPTDVLFFRDGRPMTNSLSGHAAAWPLPHIISHALHAALHRAEFDGVHQHRHGSVADSPGRRERKFGSLVNAGPFPVCTAEGTQTWYFPRPLDAGLPASIQTTFLPLHPFDTTLSSLPQPLCYPVANTREADKVQPECWFSRQAFEHYIASPQVGRDADKLDPEVDFKKDEAFAKAEYTVGIGMDAETGTQDGERIYSASYLRLRRDWCLGTLAEAQDKDFYDEKHGHDLIRALLNGHGMEIIAGGQQRVCTATLHATQGAVLPLPRGQRTDFASAITPRDSQKRWLVKWVLLTPAIWPEIEPGRSNHGTERRSHPGGWLPNWIDGKNGKVLLQIVTAEERARRRRLNYEGKGYATDENAAAIPARLVAAMVDKPLTITGYALPHEAAARAHGGAKSTHLAAPAGSVYYFEAESPEAATALADVLNWHGASAGTELKNRRSTLMGEKGYGLGVCGTWDFTKAAFHS
ncbi:CRISPR-associated protein (Cas_Cmr3) [Prosthecobacter debontii]|uniref:CRISPR-associated protein (Cas_Cmr3) n=1 Tax=Prosthecobacter debontii TaxID=48467 RepID=A0A1T4YJE3_9BACT|nr:type III-B CRISPR module-associated Cmr3 family protein [Prosthecobacter debontii]SKB01678.1 CRISPR-associated protein (Cas_Cmr3) [Prosthecobacter debontii]